MSYDTKCYDLAASFLSGTSADNDDAKDDLAQTIQDAIDDWIELEDVGVEA